MSENTNQNNNTNQPPRGIRNNNPGNIRNSEANEWKGEVSKKEKLDNSFEEFRDMPHGIRAMMQLLINYQRKYTLLTVRDLVGKWAPRTENDTTTYVNRVCKELQMPSTCPIDLTDKGTLCALVDAMIFVENNKRVPMADIEAGYALFLKYSPKKR